MPNLSFSSDSRMLQLTWLFYTQGWYQVYTSYHTHLDGTKVPRGKWGAPCPWLCNYHTLLIYFCLPLLERGYLELQRHISFYWNGDMRQLTGDFVPVWWGNTKMVIASKSSFCFYYPQTTTTTSVCPPPLPLFQRIAGLLHLTSSSGIQILYSFLS